MSAESSRVVRLTESGSPGTTGLAPALMIGDIYYFEPGPLGRARARVGHDARITPRKASVEDLPRGEDRPGPAVVPSAVERTPVPARSPCAPAPCRRDRTTALRHALARRVAWPLCRPPSVPPKQMKDARVKTFAPSTEDVTNGEPQRES